MKHYTANRLSGGNRLFPAEIKIDDFGVTVKVPNLFSGKEKSLGYDKISSVRVDNPLVGFSSIRFDTIGFDRIDAHGFSKSDAEEIKELVLLGIQNTRGGGGGISQSIMSESERSQIELEKKRIELEKQKHTEEMSMRQREHELEEKKNRQQRANELREQGKNTQAFFTEHWNAIGSIVAVVIMGGIALFFYFKVNSNDKLDSDLTRKEEQIQSLIQAGKLDDAKVMIDSLQDDSQDQSNHSKGGVLDGNYTFFEYWKSQRDSLRKQIADLETKPVIQEQPKQEEIIQPANIDTPKTQSNIDTTTSIKDTTQQ